MKTAFITGSPAGWIGSHLGPALRKLGDFTVECDPRVLNGSCISTGSVFRSRWQDVAMPNGSIAGSPASLYPADVAIHLAAHVESVDKRMAGGLDAYQDILQDYEFLK